LLEESLLQSFFVRKISAEKLQGIHWRNYPCKNVWWGRPLLPEILDQTDRVGAKSPIFDLFFARSVSPVTPSEKVQLTLIESPLRAFQ